MSSTLDAELTKYPGILHQDARCLLLLIPDGIPERDRGRFGSEGFLRWFRRRFCPLVGAWPAKSFSFSGRRFLWFSDPGLAEHDPKFESGPKGTISIFHPRYSLECDPRKVDSTESKSFPKWLTGSATDCYQGDLSGTGLGEEGYYTALGKTLLFQSAQFPKPELQARWKQCGQGWGFDSGFWKQHDRRLQGKGKADLCPEPIWGTSDAAASSILESGVRYEISFEEGYSFGLFLDQRENRWRLLNNQIEPGFPVFNGSGAAPPRILNTFSYTCGFSVCGALAGAEVVSVDLSKKYLEWGKRNFARNKLSTEGHEFLFGDVFGWIRRFIRRGNRFDLIILDPPTFSRSKEWGVFKVVRDLEKLVEQVVPLLNPGGRMLVSSNAATWNPDHFADAIRTAVSRGGRRVGRDCFATQPWDFGVVDGREAYLKTWWLEVN